MEQTGKFSNWCTSTEIEQLGVLRQTGTSIWEPSRCRGTGRGFAAKHQVRYLGPGQQPAPWTVGSMGIFTESYGEIKGESMGKSAVSMIAGYCRHRFCWLCHHLSCWYAQTPWVRCCVLIAYGSTFSKMDGLTTKKRDQFIYRVLQVTHGLVLYPTFGPYHIHWLVRQLVFFQSNMA